MIDDSDNSTAKIIDFGTSRIIERDKKMTQSIGTVSYMAPGTYPRALPLIKNFHRGF